MSDPKPSFAAKPIGAAILTDTDLALHKPEWAYGLDLMPVHLQHQTRYYERLVDAAVRSTFDITGGLTDLSLNMEAIGLGQLIVERMHAILPDGTPVVVGGPNANARLAPRSFDAELRAQGTNPEKPLDASTPVYENQFECIPASRRRRAGYSSRNPPPFSPMTEPHRVGVRTQSLPISGKYSGGFNEISMLDMPSLVFTDEKGPMKGAAYTVEGADIPPGNLTNDGVFEAKLGSHVREFVIVLPNRRHVVRVGHLDPINTPSGVIQRLSHIGYLRPEVNRMEGDFYAGLDRFRADQSITTLRQAGAANGLDDRFKDVQDCDVMGTLATDAIDALLSAHGS